ncbi:hypothetical protein PVAP13_8NG302993 [Panicum virgatum]|uniref:Uncharacterized protein n=1 Tax=Panicum virgatum TaxID=38727 RepID=A0A8T0PAV2_PANVG|nr:hypothetical protein PVAP13_8NG302993 [Panicum virgatum]
MRPTLQSFSYPPPPPAPPPQIHGALPPHPRLLRSSAAGQRAATPRRSMAGPRTAQGLHGGRRLDAASAQLRLREASRPLVAVPLMMKASLSMERMMCRRKMLHSWIRITT